MGISCRKKLNLDVISTILEHPEPSSTSGKASDELLSRGIEPRSRLATALLSLMASLNVQERRMKKECELG